MMDDGKTVLLITRIFNAKADEVFDAWMTRERWQAWMGPEGTDCKVILMEPHAGGRYRIDMLTADGSVIPISGRFEIVDRPRTLRFTWGWHGESTKQSVITISFTEEGDGTTKVTLRQDGLGTPENRHQHELGWNSALNKLNRLLMRSN